jgi:AcrR family transcriptional regulator
MTISQFPMGELVARTGVPATTIHYYRAAGLLPEPDRSTPNRFLYDERHVAAVLAIRETRRAMGLPLASIARVLPGIADGGPPSGDVRGNAGCDEPDVAARLVDAAIGLFSSPGFASVTMSDIAERAGIAKGSVYRFFPSKEELFLTAVRTCVDRAMAELETRAAALGPPLDTDDAARILGESVRPAMPLLMDLAAQTLLGNLQRLQLAREVLATLLERIGRVTAGGEPAPERAGRVLLRVIVDAFQAVVPGRAT